jgi:hypothetical protein
MRVEVQQVGDVVASTPPVQGHVTPAVPASPSTRELAEEIVKLLKRKSRR